MTMFPRQAVRQVCLLDDYCLLGDMFSTYMVYLQRRPQALTPGLPNQIYPNPLHLPAKMILRAVVQDFLSLLKRETRTVWSKRKKSMVINLLVEAMHEHAWKPYLHAYLNQCVA